MTHSGPLLRRRNPPLKGRYWVRSILRSQAGLWNEFSKRFLDMRTSPAARVGHLGPPASVPFPQGPPRPMRCVSEKSIARVDPIEARRDNHTIAGLDRLQRRREEEEVQHRRGKGERGRNRARDTGTGSEGHTGTDTFRGRGATQGAKSRGLEDRGGLEGEGVPASSLCSGEPAILFPQYCQRYCVWVPGRSPRKK